jgi:hypothetical protein
MQDGMTMPQMPVIGKKYKVDCAPLCVRIVKNEWFRVRNPWRGSASENNMSIKSLVKFGYTRPKPMCLRQRDTVLKTNVLGGENLWAPTQCSTVPNITILVPQNVIHDVTTSVSLTHITH